MARTSRRTDKWRDEGRFAAFLVGLLIFLCWFAMPAGCATANAAGSAAPDSLQVDFVAWIETIVSGLPGGDSEGFTIPSAGEMLDFRSAVLAFLGEDWTLAQTLAVAIGYEVVEIQDTANDDETIYGLVPDAENDDGRGYYFLRPRSAVSRELVVESPHPRFDMRTGVLASEVFREVGARAFALAGTHRCANTTETLCDGSTKVCNDGVWGPYRESDMAHTDAGFFQAFHEIAVEEIPGLTHALQVHGFASGASDPEFTLSDGTSGDVSSDEYLPNRFSIDLTQRVTAAGSTKGGNSCNRPGDINRLCADTNVQGRFTNGVPPQDACTTGASGGTGRFIHAELSYDLRHPGDTMEPDLFIDSVLAVFHHNQECDDLNLCTDDQRNPGTGACVWEENDDPCDDGVFCNGTDQCEDGSCSVHAGDPCGEGEVCRETLQFCDEVTAIKLVSFEAIESEGEVLLTWETAAEPENVGFHLWRSNNAGSGYARVTSLLIPSEGDAIHGAIYEHLDSEVELANTYWYKLEAIDIHGQSTFHGPVNVTLKGESWFGCGMVADNAGIRFVLFVLVACATPAIRRAAKRKMV